MGNKNRFGHRCMDCGKVQYPRRSELTKAARVRCVDCGGCLEECKAASNKIAKENDRIASWREQHGYRADGK